MQNSPPGPAFAARRRAFTLLELLVVVALIAALAGIFLGAAHRAVESGRVARARSELAALTVALETYRRLYGDYPQTDDPARLLQALLGRRGPTGDALQDPALLDVTPFTTSGGLDPYVDPSAGLLDPWRRPYVYLYKMPLAGWSNSSYVLYSAGPDGADTPSEVPDGGSDPSLPGNADNIDARAP